MAGNWTGMCNQGIDMTYWTCSSQDLTGLWLSAIPALNLLTKN